MTTANPEADLERARAELDDLVRIPSISADPAHAGDVAPVPTRCRRS